MIKRVSTKHNLQLAYDETRLQDARSNDCLSPYRMIVEILTQIFGIQDEAS